MSSFRENIFNDDVWEKFMDKKIYHTISKHLLQHSFQAFDAKHLDAALEKAQNKIIQQCCYDD